MLYFDRVGIDKDVDVFAHICDNGTTAVYTIASEFTREVFKDPVVNIFGVTNSPQFIAPVFLGTPFYFGFGYDFQQCLLVIPLNARGLFVVDSYGRIVTATDFKMTLSRPLGELDDVMPTLKKIYSDITRR